jgi:hypothetical protein
MKNPPAKGGVFLSQTKGVGKMRSKMLCGILLWLALSLLLPSATPAAVVGRLTQVEGEVTLLKKGQLPAIHLKQNDGVEPGDVVRTKSLSKAQITFVDDTVLTIAPGSRIAIEKYMIEGGKRSAVLQMFRGVALAVVSKIFKANAPDFVVKTNTAIMGVRGTKVGLRLYPNFSEILTFQGVTEVSNRFPEIPGLVQLKDGQGTRVTRGLPPTKQFKVGPQDLKQFMLQLTTGLTARVRDQDSKPDSSGSGNALARGSASSGEIMLASIPSALQPTAQEKPKQEEPTPTAPPPPPPVIEPPPPPVQPPVVEPPQPPVQPPVVEPPPNLPPYYQVSWDSIGQYTMVKGTPAGEGDPHYATYSGSLTLTSGSKVNFTVSAQDPFSPGNFNQSSSGTITWIVKGDLPLIAGTSSYGGPVTATGITQGGTVFTFTLDASYENGKLSLTNIGPVSGVYESTSTSGDFTLPSEASHKITEGTASISWTVTPVSGTAAATATPTTTAATPRSTTAVAPTVSTTSVLSPASSMDAAVVSSAITPLPLPATLTTVGPPGQAGPPGQTGAGPQGQAPASPPGQAVATAAPGSAVGPTVVTPSGVAAPGLQTLPPAALSPAVMSPVATPTAVLTPSGVAPPGLQNRPAALNNVPPGLSTAPGQVGDTPGKALGHNK